MRRSTLTLLLAVCLLAAACTGGEEATDDASAPATAQPADSATADDDTTDQVDPPVAADDGAGAAGDAGPALADGVDVAELGVPDDVLDAAHRWVVTESGLTDMLLEEIFLASASQTRDVHHLRYVQQHDGVAVRGAEFIVHVRDTGEVLGASQSLTTVLPGDDATEELTPEEAVEVAVKAVPGTVVGEPTTRSTWLERGTELRLGWQVLIETASPPSNYAVVVDATTSEVLSVDRLATDHGHGGNHGATSARPAGRDVAVAPGGCPALPPPSACVFPVDPIFATGDPGISPQEANRALVSVPLENLTNPADGDLVGQYAQIAAPLRELYRDPDNVFGEGGRGGSDITFEAAMTYYWIDYTQQAIQALGFDYHADDPVDLVPIEPEFPDNAFYLFVEDRIHMGDAPDGVREAEDAQGIIHEYGHALLQAAVPNIVSDEGGAFHEGFADLVSVFTTLEFRNGDVACLFHWAERGNCIRRVDTDLAYPDDLRFEVHLDAEIFTGAVWDVFEGVLARDTGLAPDQCQDLAANPCDAVRDEVYATLLGSLPFLTPSLSLADAAAAFAASDATFFEGRNASLIANAFADHGLPVDASTGVAMSGTASGLGDLDRSGAELALKIVHQFRGDLRVDVGVIGPGGELLCELNLKSPDGQDGADNITGRFDLIGTPCEPHLPPSPERIWLLRVVDEFDLDTGQLFQFAVISDGVRYAAGGLPLPIPDADQQGIVVAVGEDVPVDAAEPMIDDPPPPAPSGGVEARIEIAHTYVGDLSVQVAVIDTNEGTVACREDVLAPDPEDASDDLSVTVDLSRCGGLYPPSAQNVWILRVVDRAAADVGQVTTFALTGPDGQVREASVPVDIPDNDPEGVVVSFAE